MTDRLVNQQLEHLVHVVLVLVKNHLCPQFGARDEVDPGIVGDLVDLWVNLGVHLEGPRGEDLE